MLMIRWQHVAVGFDQFVDEGPDLVQAELGGGMRIEHGCVIDVLALAGQGRFHNQRLDVDVRLLKGCQMRRHLSNFGRLETVLIYKAGDFDTTALGQIIDESIVRNISIHNTRRFRFPWNE